MVHTQIYQFSYKKNNEIMTPPGMDRTGYHCKNKINNPDSQKQMPCFLSHAESRFKFVYK